MLKVLVIIGGGIGALVAAFYVFSIFSLFSFHLNPLYESCMELGGGMTKQEISDRLSTYRTNPDYGVVEGQSGNYGWLNRLSYDDSISVVMLNDPWYKLDQHPWSCTVYFKDNLAQQIVPFFD